MKTSYIIVKLRVFFANVVVNKPKQMSAPKCSFFENPLELPRQTCLIVALVMKVKERVGFLMEACSLRNIPVSGRAGHVQ